MQTDNLLSERDALKKADGNIPLKFARSLSELKRRNKKKLLHKETLELERPKRVNINQLLMTDRNSNRKIEPELTSRDLTKVATTANLMSHSDNGGNKDLEEEIKKEDPFPQANNDDKA